MDKRKKRKADKMEDLYDMGLNPSDKSFIYDKVDEFNDVEDEHVNYNNISEINEENLEEQVWGIGGSSSEEDEYSGDEEEEYSDEEEEDNELFKNDIESSEENSDPEKNERVMGKKKKFYFGTDLTDQRLHKISKSRSSKKVESLELEKEGTKQFQRRMRQELDTTTLPVALPIWRKLAKMDDETLPQQIQEIQLDAPSKSKPKKAKSLKHLKKTNPELLANLTDLKEKAEELRLILSPLMEAKKKGLIPTSPAANYLHTRYFLSLNYLNVISAYIMLKCSKNEISQHPAETRLAQYRHLFKELEPCKQRYESQLSTLLEDLNSGALERTKRRSERKVLKVLKSKQDKIKKKKKKKKTVQFSDSLDAGESDENMQVEEENASNKGGGQESRNPDGRRVISKAIAKNKGLTPTRKKEQRNPRVKYKKKYQNKLKRRKGQVREVRKELKRYDGEISGIKANLVKSIKLQ